MDSEGLGQTPSLLHWLLHSSSLRGPGPAMRGLSGRVQGAWSQVVAWCAGRGPGGQRWGFILLIGADLCAATGCQARGEQARPSGGREYYPAGIELTCRWRPNARRPDAWRSRWAASPGGERLSRIHLVTVTRTSL